MAATKEKEKMTMAVKQVIDGLPANAFRVVGVGGDIVLEAFYLYPNFSGIDDRDVVEFNTDPEKDSEPNIRIIMNREVAIRLANALVGTLNAGFSDEPQAASDK